MEQFPLLKPRDSIDIITEQISDYWIQLHHNSSHQDLSPLFSDIMRNCRNYVNLTIMEETFCLLFYVRDISHGLGLRQVFYMMMMHLYDSFPMLALSVYPILLQYYDPLPYGSWRDVTGLCDYLKHHSQRGEEHPLVMSVLEYLNRQLKQERDYFSHHGTCDTNMVKWIPREKSRNGWVFSLLAHHWAGAGAGAGARTYRKLVSKLRCSISITERHMCNRQWEHIHPKQVTHGSLAKYWYAICDQSRDFSHQHSSSYDRMICSQQIGRHLFTQTSGLSQSIPTHNFPFAFPACIGKYVSYAMQCIRSQENQSGVCSTISVEIFRLNRIWERILSGVKRKYKTHDYVPVIQIHDAITSKNTCDTLGKALLLYQTGHVSGIYFDGHNPHLIQIQPDQSFLSQIETIYYALHESILPYQHSSHSKPPFGKKSLLISNGHCSVENKCHFIGQKNTEAYTNPFDAMCAVLFHPRYQFVRRKFRIIVQAPPEATPSYPTSF